MEYVWKNKRLKKIIIDLDSFRIDIFFPNSKNPLSLFFDTPSRKFFCSVIALVVIEMKKKSNLGFLNIRTKERKEKLIILDQKLSGKNTSGEPEQLFDKIRTAWRYRLPNIEKGSNFIVTYCSEKMNFDKMDEHEYGYLKGVVDAWPGLFGYDKNKTWHYRFDLKNATITLKDVRIIFGQNKDMQAWERFIEYIESKEEDKAGKEQNRVDARFQQKAEVIRFLKYFEKRFMYLKILHTQQKVKMNDQFEPIQVTPERTHRHDVESFWVYTDSEKELKRAYAFKCIERESLLPISWNEAKKMSKRIMVLADPGMGKTTLLKSEAVMMARQEREKLEKSGKTIDDFFFPIFLRLSDFSKSEAVVCDDILKIVKHRYRRITRKILDILKNKIETGKCVLFFDALDEVSIEDRNILSEKLNDFIEDYPCHIICTSRIVGYPGFFLDNAKEFEIVPFNQEQIRNYLKNWFESAADSIKDKSVSAEGLLHELKIKPQIGGLAQNPLLLSLICSLYQEKDIELPTRRYQVYQKSLDYMLSLKGRKRIPCSESRIEAKLSILEEMAYYFSCNNQEIFTLNELLIWCRKYIGEGKALTSFNNADSVITELSEDDGILIKLDKKKFIFFHLTFQEFLTASYINNVFDKDKKCGIHKINKHYRKRNWYEILALLTGLMKDPIYLITDIANRKDDIFKNLLILTIKCITEIIECNHPFIYKTIDEFLEFWRTHYDIDFVRSTLIEIGNASSYVRKKLIISIYDENKKFRRSASNILYHIVKEDMVEALIGAREHDDIFVRESVLIALGRINSPLKIPIIMQDLKNKDSHIRYRALRILDNFYNEDVQCAVIDKLKDENENVRILAASKLANQGYRKALPILLKALNNSDVEIRRSVVNGLKNRHSQVVIKALTKAQEDQDILVRFFAKYKVLGYPNNEWDFEKEIKMLKENKSSVTSPFPNFLDYLTKSVTIVEILDNYQIRNGVIGRPTPLSLSDVTRERIFRAYLLNLQDNDMKRSMYARKILTKINPAWVLKKIIIYPEIDLYHPAVFSFARNLSFKVKNKEDGYFPIYPELIKNI